MVSSPLHVMPYLAERLVKATSFEESHDNIHHSSHSSIVNVDDPASGFYDSPVSSDDEGTHDGTCDDITFHLPPRKSIRKSALCADHSSNNKATTKKSVAFGDVRTRSYNVVMGDHPCCTMGCALSLGWEHSQAPIVSVDEYEATRSPRRTRDSLRTTWDERRTMLADVSDGEVKRAARKLHRERSCQRKNRTRTCAAFFQQELPGDARIAQKAAHAHSAASC